MSLVQYSTGSTVEHDPTTHRAPSSMALGGWLEGAGFTPTYLWQEGLRGGAVAVRHEHGATNERVIDEAAG